MIVLLGIVIVVIGFKLKYDTIAVVVFAGVVTGLLAHIPILEIIRILGKAFVDTRYITIFILTLPAVGLCERYGLREKAVDFVKKSKKVTVGRILFAYLLFRELAGALGLRLSGIPQFVRPLINPIAQGAAINKYEKIDNKDEDLIKGRAASMDNIGNFFSEDVFIANAGVLLVVGCLGSLGYKVDAVGVAIASIPIAVLSVIWSFLENKFRDMLLDKKYLKRKESKK